MLFCLGGLLLIVTFLLVMVTGAVDIPAGEVVRVLFGKSREESSFVQTIVLENRFPMAVSAICCGAMLSVAGLVMQTVFRNPLAGPSVLGVSSGASFGVALLTLGAGGVLFSLNPGWSSLIATIGALAGGLLTILILFAFSSALKSPAAILIAGIMLSYVFSSGISLLNYFSPAEEIRNYLVWGLGSFMGLRFSSSLWLALFSIIALAPVIFFIKPLNAVLMGERYLESVGYSLKRVRSWLLVLTGILVAVPTAFCGPIGFIGLIVPHLCRLMFRSSNHLILLPATILFGAVLCLFCAFLEVLPSSALGILPINVITPFLGVPVVLYLLVNKNKIPYFA